MDEGIALPPQMIADEARLLHALPERPAGRDAELAAEVGRLNAAVIDLAQEFDFDDQPGDFLALLMTLRESDGTP